MVSEYFLGLDIGTNSIGWAVADKSYKMVRIKGKDLWGVHLFEEAKTAAERRTFRCARRRIERRKQRLKLLKEFFEAEISKIDPGFFDRLSDSFFISKHKKENQKNSLFNDKEFNDKAFHTKYPTIYHLRSELIHNNEKHDIRLIYLAVSHILKNRGHFLFEDENMSVGSDFNKVYNEWSLAVEELYESSFSLTDTTDFENIIKNRIGCNEKKKRFKGIFTDKSVQPLLELLSGAKVAPSKIFEGVDSEAEPKKISFADGKFDEIKDSLASSIGEDNMRVVELTKALYDWGILSELLGNNEFLSDAKKEIYDRHSEDLKILKKVIKKYCSQDKYNEVFKSNTTDNNYTAYVNGCIIKGKKELPKKTCKRDDFYAYIKKILLGIESEDEDIKEILAKIENTSFMPKQVTTENSVIPHQVHLHELKKILENAEKHYMFLCEKDEYGTVTEKILSIFAFRIPYYVGPLNNHHKKYSWIEKKENIPVLPWNFDDVVDVEESAKEFILRMTNYCTYFTSEKVLPKNSILYCTYEMLNELNNLRVNEEKLSYELKTKIINEVFKKKVSPKIKDVEKLIKKETAEIDLEFSGLADDFKSSLKPYIDFYRIIGDRADNTEMVDEIISLITIFGDDKKILVKELEKSFGDEFCEKEIKAISSFKYSGWGRFSKKLLDGIMTVDESTGEARTIIKVMEETSENFMQIIFEDKYSFKSQLEEESKNADLKNKPGSYASLEDLYVSPANKKRIWRAIGIVKEIVKINKSAPEKIFIEMTRSEEEIKKQKDSRKKKLEALYKSVKNEKELIAELGKETDVTLRQKKLYLYFMQLGRCMYSGERLSISDLSMCDIDHIIPQSVKKDDSFENTVLVYKTLNAKKSDTYPIEEEKIISPEAKKLWQILLHNGFLSKEKYNRIIRKTPLTVDEKASFIERQIVDTSQTTKAVAEILKKMYPETEIVYVKANHVSEFRNGAYIKKEEKEQYKDDKLIKCREVNDYHHAKDAYLNIVAGNIFNEKFNHNPAAYSKSKGKYSLREFIKSGEKYNLARIYEFDVQGANWISGHDGTIEQIKKVMSKNNILCSELPQEFTGGFSDQMPVRAGKAQMPFKLSDSRLSENIDIYGGYNKVSGAYFSIIRSVQKGKKVITVESVPVYMRNEINFNNEKLKNYFESEEGFSEVEILIPCMKPGTLIKKDGFYLRVTGRTGNSILTPNAVQLVLTENLERYAKNLSKLVAALTQNQNVSADDFKVTSEENILFYMYLKDKFENTIYNKVFSAQAKNLDKGKENFEKLSASDQAKVLLEILKILRCNSQSGDLTLIGGSGRCGILQPGKDITNCSEFKIIHQSLTGFYEKEIDVLKL